MCTTQNAIPYRYKPHKHKKEGRREGDAGRDEDAAHSGRVIACRYQPIQTYYPRDVLRCAEKTRKLRGEIWPKGSSNWLLLSTVHGVPAAAAITLP